MSMPANLASARRYSLDIAIVNWNAGAQLKDCLNAIAESDLQTVDLRRVVVVDNRSQDGSPDLVDAAALPLTVLRNDENVGFARASNQGARGSTSDFLLFLNPDVKLSTDCIQKASDALAAGGPARLGIVGVQMRDALGRISSSCARFPTVKIVLSESSGLSRLRSGLFPEALMTDWDHRGSDVVNHVIGAFYLVRRDLFEELGGFDDRYFLYLEDLDFSFRAAQKGWRCFYTVETAAYHAGGGCSRRIPIRRQYYLARSRARYARKHLGWPCAILSGVLSVLTVPVAGAFLGLSRLLPAARGRLLKGVRQL